MKLRSALALPLFFAWIALPLAGRPALAAGTTPADPIPWDVEGSPVALSFPSYSTQIWFRASPRSTVQASHFELRTVGSLDTRLYVYANLADALADRYFASDDDSGEGWNAQLKAAIGFTGPYLIKARAWSTGSSSLAGKLTPVTAAERCAWPAGCTLATAAENQPSGGKTLVTLRAVRDEILSATAAGRELEQLYWQIGSDLVPALILDSEFRASFYRQVAALLPLAHEALAETRQQPSSRLLRAADVEALHSLLTLIGPRLEARNGAALDAAWQEFGLESQIGRSVREVLVATAMLPDSPRPTTLLVKLRSQPDLQLAQKSTGLPPVDALLATSPVRALRPVHPDLPENRAAGLGSTLAIDILGEAAATAVLDRLKASPEVEWAEENRRVRAHASTQDPYSGQLWGLDAVNAQLAWPATTGSCTVPVAVIDTGLRPDLLDFTGRILPGRGWDFANDDNDPLDLHGHGTHVAGTIAANVNNSVSVAGVAPGVCFFAVKVLSDAGDGTMEDVAAGIVHAANQGAKIINMSLGCDASDSRCFSNTMEDAMAYAASRDVLIVVSAGNDGVDSISYPASSPWALSVGAVDSSLSLAEFSNYGPGLDLVAPGVDVASVFTDGESCLGSGTSMAAPHVSGVAALLRTAKPAWNRSQVTQALLRTCRDLGAPGFDPIFGNGLVDALGVLNQADPCAGGLCLHNRRFAVRLTWRDFAGNTGTGKLAPISSGSSGLFWFFDAQNWEVLVKVLNGCGYNNRFWVYSAATTNVEYTLYVTDTFTGTTRSYFNPLGVAAPAITDGGAFDTCSASAAGSPGAEAEELGALLAAELPGASPEILSSGGSAAGLAPEATACGAGDLCLNQNRFKVEILWRDFRNVTGHATKVSGGASADSGLMWFFDPSNWEALVKVLNGCAINNRYWVYAAATTDVEYTLRITDTARGTVKEYFNPLGRAAPAITDIGAFASCP